MGKEEAHQGLGNVVDKELCLHKDVALLSVLVGLLLRDRGNRHRELSELVLPSLGAQVGIAAACLCQQLM